MDIAIARSPEHRKMSLAISLLIIPWLRLLLILIILVVMFSLLSPRFLSPSNWALLCRQSAPLAFIAIGMGFVIISFGIDLSVGSGLAMTGAVGAMVLISTKSTLLGILAALGGGLLVGLIHGLCIGLGGLSFFMVTLATMGAMRGLAMVFTRATSIIIRDYPAFMWLGRTSWMGIPVILSVLIPAYAIFYLVLNWTRLGLHCYALGGNEETTSVCGINVGWTRVIIYTISGLLVGIAAIATVGRMECANCWAGLGLELEVITAVIIGGCSLRGGEGTMEGMLMGVIIVATVTNGLYLLEISAFYQYIIRGLLVLGAVSLDKLSVLYRPTR